MKLTEKQENFALEYVLNGGNASDAYRKCYDVGEDTQQATIWRNAHKILNGINVLTRVDELREERYKGKIMSIGERKKLLSEMSTDGNLKALDMLNKMDGVYVEKQEITASHEVKRTIIVNPTKKQDG